MRRDGAVDLWISADDGICPVRAEDNGGLCTSDGISYYERPLSEVIPGKTVVKSVTISFITLRRLY